MYFTKWLNDHSSSKRLKVTPYLRAVHRLDRASSGVLIFAKTKAALTHLMGQFERRETEKIYRALVEKAPKTEAGKLEHFHKRTEDGKKALILTGNEAGTQPCELAYKTLRMRGKQAELEIQPLTGRFHQIRAQLAHIGCPIVGDVLYGGKALVEHEIKLHAERLTVIHPISEQQLVLEAPLGEDW